MNETVPDSIVASEIAEVLESLVKCVVTQPSSVKVGHSVHGNLIALIVKTDQNDVRRVIGAKGKHFKALQGIVASLAKQVDFEAHLAVDDKGPPPPAGAPAPKIFSLGQYNQQGFERVKVLLSKLVSMFLSSPNVFEVISTDIANTTIFEIRVKADEYQAIYGTEVPFDYGNDGHIIGAIKNIFDGIGKNHGRIIRISLNRV